MYLPGSCGTQVWLRIGAEIQAALQLALAPSVRAMQDQLDELLDDFEATGSHPPNCQHELQWLLSARASRRHANVKRQSVPYVPCAAAGCVREGVVCLVRCVVEKLRSPCGQATASPAALPAHAPKANLVWRLLEWLFSLSVVRSLGSDGFPLPPDPPTGKRSRRHRNSQGYHGDGPRAAPALTSPLSASQSNLGHTTGKSRHAVSDGDGGTSNDDDDDDGGAHDSDDQGGTVAPGPFGPAATSQAVVAGGARGASAAVLGASNRRLDSGPGQRSGPTAASAQGGVGRGAAGGSSSNHRGGGGGTGGVTTDGAAAVSAPGDGSPWYVYGICVL